MKGEQMGWHSPPKAEVTGSNPVGCTKKHYKSITYAFVRLWD